MVDLQRKGSVYMFQFCKLAITKHIYTHSCSLWQYMYYTFLSLHHFIICIKPHSTRLCSILKGWKCMASNSWYFDKVSKGKNTRIITIQVIYAMKYGILECTASVATSTCGAVYTSGHKKYNQLGRVKYFTLSFTHVIAGWKTFPSHFVRSPKPTLFVYLNWNLFLKGPLIVWQ